MGGGAVGLCCALYLQLDGHRVTVFDPSEPGTGTSGGNAGLITSSAVVPTAMPGVIRRVPRMLMDPLGPLTVSWRYLPWIAPWLVRFVLASRAARVERISIALKGLVDNVRSSYELLWSLTGTDGLIERSGLLIVYRSEAALARGQEALRLRERRGIGFQILRGDAIAEIEPILDGIAKAAVFYPKTMHTVDPRAMLTAFADYFVRQGGRIVRARVIRVDAPRNGPLAIRTVADAHAVDAVVLAAGAWSRDLAADLGARVPLDTERGYVVELPRSGITLRHPLISPDLGIAVTPMARALRLTGTVELAGLHAPPNPAQPERIVRGARTLFPRLETGEMTTWMGYRPSMPDSMPVIGRTPRRSDVFFAFGHGHDGLGLAAVTGRVIAELVGDRPTSLDIAAFRADRFGWR